MRELWWRIRKNWNSSDTTVFGVNTMSLLLFIGNCWWESVPVTYLATLLPLILQMMRSKDATLSESILFGAIVAGIWPMGEWFTVTTFGWWGEYLAQGILIMDTPDYCILIGWLSSAYLYYIGKRTVQIGYGNVVSGFVIGLSALGLGVIGENLFVEARMWVYVPSRFDLWNVPAFVPVSYGIVYSILPKLRGMHMVCIALLITFLMLIVSIGLGLAVGFFPQR